MKIFSTEKLLSNKVDPNEEVIELLSKLHSFSDKIKFNIREVNGIYNIVYEDEKMITQDILDKLRSRRFWNIKYSPRTAAILDKYSGNKINISFNKYVQDDLNIKEFDKKDWSPKLYK